MCHARGNCGEPFNAKRGITQGGPLSSLMFNVCVDAVVREWLHQMLDEDDARDGIDNQVSEILMEFYINEGLLASQEPVWLQELFNMGGIGRCSMRLLRLLGSPLHSHLKRTGTSLRGWKCSNIWVSCWPTTTTIPRLCSKSGKSAQELGAGFLCFEGRECFA